MDFSNFMSSYWWILVILISLILYKFILRFLFGMVIVPENRLGLVTKKFVLYGANKALPDGRIMATCPSTNPAQAFYPGNQLLPLLQ